MGQRWAAQAQAQAPQYAAAPQYQAAPPPAEPAPADGAGDSSMDRLAALTRLGELKAQGVLTEEEFTAEKAKIGS